MIIAQKEYLKAKTESNFAKPYTEIACMLCDIHCVYPWLCLRLGNSLKNLQTSINFFSYNVFLLYYFSTPQLLPDLPHLLTHQTKILSLAHSCSLLLYTEWPETGNNLDAHQLMNGSWTCSACMQRNIIQLLRKVKFSGQWMDQEPIILREVTQTKRTNIACFLFYVYVSF